MGAEANLRSKFLYKTELLVLKYIPFLLAIIYFFNTLLSLFDINAVILSYVAGISILPWVFILISSFVFRFCAYHRIPLYYILVNDDINVVDSYLELPISDLIFISIHSVIFFICFIAVFTLRKKCKRNDEHDKKISL